MAHTTSSRDRPRMCGTSKRSRTMRTPRRGTLCVRVGPGASPSRADLKVRCRSAAVTWSPSGVSASYMRACSSAPGGIGTPPCWPEGTMLSAVSA